MILWCEPGHPGLVRLVEAQQREILATEGQGAIVYPLYDGIEFVLVLLNGNPVACGAMQPLEPGVAEVKRMYVRPDHRGRGLSRAILAAIEARAERTGVHTLRLETGRKLPVARKLYSSSGYVEIPLYGEYVGNPESVCFEKRLTAVTVDVTP